MEINVSKEIADLTNLNEKHIRKLFSRLQWSMCDGLSAIMDTDDKYVSCDIGIGKIVLIVDDSSLRYNFIPSGELEDSLIKTITTGVNPLEVALEKTLITKLTKTYKDLL